MSAVRAGGIGLLVALLACGPEGEADRAPEASGSVASETAATAAGAIGRIPADRAGAFELDGERYDFLVLHCDLSGESSDGMLLRGSGTAPDGRPVRVEVERLAGGETLDERASAYFGGIAEGDHWTARAIRGPGGSWSRDEMGEVPVEGPLIGISGNGISATGSYRNESDGSEKPGTIRATCPA